jgi:hypothetical protein
MAKPKKPTPAPAEPVEKTVIAAGYVATVPFEEALKATSVVIPVKATVADTPPPVSGPRKNAPSGAKRLVHNGVVVDIPDTVKRRAQMSYDETSVDVECPKDMDAESFRAYVEHAASEMAMLLDERNRRSKQSKAAERNLTEMRASIAALTIESAGGAELYARMFEQKAVDVAQATRRAADASFLLKAQDALLEDAKRRWLSAE